MDDARGLYRVHDGRMFIQCWGAENEVDQDHGRVVATALSMSDRNIVRSDP
jgi:hypothetical protein